MREFVGLYLRFGEEIDPAVNARVHALARALLEAPPEGVTDIVPSYTTLYIEFDRARLSERHVRSWAEAYQGIAENATMREPRVVRVRYDGPDLTSVAEETGLTVEEVVRRHAAPTYRVYALGFTPGFPFLGEVDPAIRRGRLPVPRAQVEPHSVGIADAQCGIYPLPSPGGWRLLGTALEAVYDPYRERPFLLEPGEEVQFVPAEGEPPAPVEPLALLPTDPRDPILRVVEPGLMDLIVDRGRLFAGRFGLARSGPADPRSATLANRLLANPPDAPMLEINVTGPTLEVLDDAVVVFAGWGVAPQRNGEALESFVTTRISRGDILRFPPGQHGVRGYLAVAGGIESGQFLRSASVDVRGLIGRPLRDDDVLGRATSQIARSGFGFRPWMRFRNPVTLRLLPGPQANDAALAALTAETYVVAHADRMGLQFEGPEVPGGGVLSEPNPLGALQITSGGRPLLLMQDRGTIGGYMKPAVVHPTDLPRAAQLRVGERVRFALARQ